MQNKHFFSFLGIPTYGEGGGQAGWAKFPIFTENLFLGLPLYTENKHIIYHAKKHLYSSDANSIETQLDNCGVSAIGDDQSASGSLMSSPQKRFASWPSPFAKTL